MKFSSTTVVLYLLSGVSVSLAVAVPDTTPWLQGRKDDLVINSLPNEEIYCVDSEGQWVVITPGIISDSIDKAARKKTGSVEGYPSVISNPESIPNLATTSSTLYHYPIAETSRGIAVYDGRNWAGNLRVFYTKGKSSFTYKGIATHAGAEEGQYVACGTWAEWHPTA